MNFKQQFQTLTSQQQSELLSFIQESVGCNCDYGNFTEIALGLIDDIAGFESANDCQIRLLVNQLWEIYQN
jgi:hypothetical protein